MRQEIFVASSPSQQSRPKENNRFFKAVSNHKNSARQKTLQQYQFLNTAPEPDFDDLAYLASYICQAPIALIGLIDGKRQWFKSKVGWNLPEISTEISFCSQTILQTNLLIVPDTLADTRFATNPFVLGSPNIRFYAGIPLINPEGIVLGTLSIMDFVPRTLTWAQQEALRTLSRQVINQLELRRQASVLKQVSPHLSNANLSEPSHLLSLADRSSATLKEDAPLPQILQNLTKVIASSLDVAATIWTFNSKTNQLELVAVAGDEHLDEPLPRQISTDSYPLGRVAQTGEYIWNFEGSIFPVELEAEPAIFPFDNLLFHRYLCGYPLIIGTQTLGVMALFSSHALAAETHTILSSIANNLVLAMDRIRVRQEAMSRREALLLRLSSQIRTSLDVNTILETAVTEIQRLFEIDRCNFIWYFPPPDDRSICITHDVGIPDMPPLPAKLPGHIQALLSQKILKLETLRIDSINSDSNLDSDTRLFFNRLQITSHLVLPLKTRAGQFGAIACSYCNRVRNWSENEVDQLQAVVDQIAISIDYAELYGQTRASAFAAQVQAQQLSEVLYKLRQTQAQLIQQEKMSSLGQLVAGVAHEINNPVNFINGNLIHSQEYIKDLLKLLALYQQNYPEPSAEIQDFAEEIDADFIAEDLPKMLTSMKMGADRICKIVLSLRNFSRLDEAEIKSVDIHEGIDNTLLILQSRLKANGNKPAIEVIKNYGNLPLIKCYPGQLNQVFMNVLSNAIDALDNKSAPRNISITTEVLETTSNPGSFSSAATTETNTSPSVVIRIRDNGPGIEESIKSRLFDPFFTTKPVGKGTGLGLSISYQIIVEKHGGELCCFSEPGQGSEFYIQIPIHTFDG